MIGSCLITPFRLSSILITIKYLSLKSCVSSYCFLIFFSSSEVCFIGMHCIAIIYFEQDEVPVNQIPLYSILYRCAAIRPF